MTKLTIKIAVPIILAGIFSIIVFIAMDNGQLKPSFYAVVLFLVIFVFFFGLSIGQNLSSLIKKLLGGANELSRGNLSSRVYLETKDEFAELAKALNKIAEELEASREREINTEQSIGIKVKAKTKDLEETINALDQKVKNRTIELERIAGELAKLKDNVKSK